MTAEDAVLHVASLRFETFVEVRVVQNAVLHCLTVIGEAAGRISEASAAELPDLPWRKMKNLRNFIVHEYEGVNMPIIWGIVTDELPKVIAALDRLFPERKTQ
jgi:uncharacterized protein with HEPN domain